MVRRAGLLPVPRKADFSNLMSNKSRWLIKIIFLSLIASFFLVFFLIDRLSFNVSKANPAPKSCSFSSGNCPAGWEEKQEGGGNSHCVDGRLCRKVRIECRNKDTGEYCVLRTEEKCTKGENKRCRKQIPTPTPTSTPVVTPTTTPVTTLTPTPTPTTIPTDTPVPSGTPNSCGGTCGSNYNCQSGLFCYQGFCRNPFCPSETGCGCRATSTPPAVLGVTAPPRLPETGGGFEVVLGLLGIGGAGIYLLRKFELI